MKQRFSSLDVKVIAHELHESLNGLRLANIYDLSSRILLLKFAKSENKKQLIVDSGFRCHLTEFARTTAAAPSQFVARLRKVLKTRRVTSVKQIGTDRVLEFQFSDGQYRLFLEFFASGNVILTDAELKILTLLRNVSEGESQEPQRVGLAYSMENRQNVHGIPPLTKERVRDALQGAVDKAATAASAGKKLKSKPGEELRKALASTFVELPPILVEHAFAVCEFDPKHKPADILVDDGLLDHLALTLHRAKDIGDEATSSAKCTGYIAAKHRAKPAEQKSQERQGTSKRQDLLYEDFQPFLPHKYASDSELEILKFDGFNKTVDEFYSSLEGQKLESKLNEREALAKRKLDAARQDQANRLEGLREAQFLNLRKAAAIEANVERVQEAMDAVNSLLQDGMDWVDLEKLVKREQGKNNPVASIIKLPLRLKENMISLLIGEEENMEEEDSAYETDSSVSDNEDAAASEASKQRGADSRLTVDINLGLTPWANAREYYEEKRSAAIKEQKTAEQSEKALKNQEQKITADLKKGLKQEKPVLQPIRKELWFEKFIWFISSDGHLVLAGWDAQQNEILYKRYLRKGDLYCHADLHGAATVIIKNNPKTPDAPIPPSTLSQAGSLAVCTSDSWDSKAIMAAWWVNADQVSKSAPTGEFLPTGSFMIRGKKNYLPPAQLLLGFGLMFRISEESKAKHVKNRLHSAGDDGHKERSVADSAIGNEDEGDAVAGPSGDIGDESEAENADDDEDKPAANPLQSSGKGEESESESEVEAEKAPSHGMEALKLEETESQANEKDTNDTAVEVGAAQPDAAEPEPEAETAAEEEEEEEEEEEVAQEPAGQAGGSVATEKPPTDATSSKASTAAPGKKAPPKRGQRGKAKKMAAKYKDQDDEDRAAAEALIGAKAGRDKAEAEARARAQREADAAALKERRRAQHEKRQREIAEHEEVRRLMLDEGVEVLDADEAEQATALDALVGTPLPGDEILEVVPVCAPWSAMARIKYKAKLQPGPVKKGKAVREVLERWRGAAGRKGVVDEKSADRERMWPREVELIKGLKTEEAISVVPVSKVRVMAAGGAAGGGGGGGGSGGGGGKGQQGKGRGGGKGKKR